MSSVRWNIVVSPDTDQSVLDRRGDHAGCARFIEEAVRPHILELTAEQAKAANANVSETDLTAIVAEAVQWARTREH